MLGNISNLTWILYEQLGHIDGPLDYDTFWAIIKCCLAVSIFLVRITEKWDNMQKLIIVETVLLVPVVT